MKLIYLGFVLTLCLVSLVEAANQQPQCAKKGEYCLTHTDCCSMNCLTYSYKCIRNLQPYPYYYYGTLIVPPKPENEKPAISLDDLLYQAFPSRSYSENNDEDLRKTQDQEVQTTTTVAKVDNRIGEEITSEESTNRNTTCLRVGEKCYRHSDCCTQRCHGFLHQCVT